MRQIAPGSTRVGRQSAWLLHAAAEGKLRGREAHAARGKRGWDNTPLKTKVRIFARSAEALDTGRADLRLRKF